ncbi:MAG: NUDIX domain-containing protein [Firmicutes bacterium]|nr:NUDIX domain-containing protein [Bacillota bacterium]
MEWNDIYDARFRRTGRIHQRGKPWGDGEYGLVVCVWVYDGAGRVLLTRRAPQKSFAGTWENSGGAAKAGENSRTAIRRELLEETGIRAEKSEFEFIGSDRDHHAFYHFYCLRRAIPIEEIVLQPGETDGAKWVTLEEIHEMIARGEICRIISGQFLRQEKELLKRQNSQIEA